MGVKYAHRSLLFINQSSCGDCKIQRSTFLAWSPLLTFTFVPCGCCLTQYTKMWSSKYVFPLDLYMPSIRSFRYVTEIIYFTQVSAPDELSYVYFLIFWQFIRATWCPDSNEYFLTHLTQCFEKLFPLFDLFDQPPSGVLYQLFSFRFSIDITVLLPDFTTLSIFETIDRA